MNKIIFVVGTTATGKSDFSLSIAKEINAGIVNGDSLQVYQGLDIGTAKPTQEEMKSIPHYLFDHIKEGGDYTAGEYRRQALDVIERELPHRPLLIVGGSGFYFKALEWGMYDIPPVSDEILEELKSELSQKGSEKLYDELLTKDPGAAAEIKPQDPYRIQRALAILRAHGKTLTEFKKEFHKNVKPLGKKYPLVKIGLYLEKEELRERVKKRAQKMLENGFVEEVEGLLSRGFRDWSPLQSVGYKEVVQYLEKQISKDELLEAIVMGTMKLAKKQRTWFKKDLEIKWFHAARERQVASKWLTETEFK